MMMRECNTAHLDLEVLNHIYACGDLSLLDLTIVASLLVLIIAICSSAVVQMLRILHRNKFTGKLTLRRVADGDFKVFSIVIL